MNEVFVTALQFANQGICTVPVATDGSKRPGLAKWEQYQKQLPTVEELQKWFSNAQGVGVICGKVSGNLEMIELEGRAVADKLHIEIAEIAKNSGLEELWNKINSGYVETTPSGGLHWLYRVNGNAKGNTKLARRPGENGGIEVLAETRGEGGFVIVSPTNGTCHPSGGKWQILIGSPDSIPTLSESERDALYSLFTIFDQIPKPEHLAEEIKTKHDEHLTPGDDYNAKVTWSQILEPLGWAKVYSKGESIAWRRPGKNEGVSATTNFNGNDKLYVFSTSTIFDAERSYSKFAAYAKIEHNDDFRAAASALRKMGYGSSKPNEISTFTPDFSVYAPSGVEMRDEEGNIADSSWIPKEIGEYEVGEDAKPTMLRREDGNFILYPAKVNAIFGESESGKTWVALEAVRQELIKGEIVFYIDFEDSARGILNRLNTLKTPTNGFKAFRYANPDSPFTAGVSEAIKAELAHYKPSLVVVDGVNAAMNLMGLDLEKNKDATHFSQTILKPLRLFGAGILTIDHVTKSKDNRGNYAIGAQAKRADIDGVAVAVSVAQPFGRGIDGALDLTVTKDRPGFVRAICPDAKTLGIANLRSNPDGSISISISGGSVVVSSAEQRMEQVSQFLERHGYEMNFNEIKNRLRDEGIGMGSDVVRFALDGLVARGSVAVRRVGQKNLYAHKSNFIANDVNPWKPNGTEPN